MAGKLEEFTEQKVMEKLSRFHDTVYTYQYASHRSAFRSCRLASVLVPLFVKQGQVYVLLTIRSSAMKRHAGDVAFPGGMKDVQDKDEVETALRESHEEVGLRPNCVTIGAKLLPRMTRYRVYMVPVVGLISKDFVAVPNEEVEDVFSLPLSRFLKDDNHEMSAFTVRGVSGTIHIFQDEGQNGKVYTTWGLTASVCVELAVALLGKNPAFPCDITVDDPFGEQKKYLEDYERRSSL